MGGNPRIKLEPAVFWRRVPKGRVVPVSKKWAPLLQDVRDAHRHDLPLPADGRKPSTTERDLR